MCSSWRQILLYLPLLMLSFLYSSLAFQPYPLPLSLHRYQSKAIMGMAVDYAVPDVAQLAAVTSQDRSVLLIAGPGCGKTRVLSARLAFLLLHCIASPSAILLLSFTKNGAIHLRQRSDVLLQGTVASTAEVSCETFHSFCGGVLKKHIHLLSSRKTYAFSIADDDYQMKVLRDIIAERGGQGGGFTDSKVRSVLMVIRLWKELGHGYSGMQMKNMLSWEEKLAFELYPDYQRKLRSHSCLDFGDLLLYTLKLFRTFPSVLNEYRARFRHILVDEFQDVSPAQYDVLRLLSNGFLSDESSGMAGAVPSKVPLIKDSNTLDSPFPSPLSKSALLATRPFPPLDFQPGRSPPQPVSVFCAGDDDQSIYGWRGAQIQLMRRFKYDFPSARVLRFGTTYRLPESLCAATTSIAAGLSDRIPKLIQASTQMGPMGEGGHTSISNPKVSQPTISILEFATEQLELQTLVQQLLQRSKEGSALGDAAILLQTNSELRQLEQALTQAGVPFTQVCSFENLMRFFSKF